MGGDWLFHGGEEGMLQDVGFVGRVVGLRDQTQRAWIVGFRPGNPSRPGNCWDLLMFMVGWELVPHFVVWVD